MRIATELPRGSGDVIGNWIRCPRQGVRCYREFLLVESGSLEHLPLGVLITGAARLMLGIAELKTEELGLDWAFCDTDSLAIIRPDCISRGKFRQKTRQIVDWFELLNPYKQSGSVLKIEDVNYGIDSKEREPLYCFAISAKRYALFNIDS